MKRLFAPRHLAVLGRLAHGRALLAFDFDGTLAPIVASPARARVRTPTFALFKAVCALYPTVVISGRGRRDVAERLRGARVRHIIGNHGLEQGGAHDARGAGLALAHARAALARLVTAEPGLELEDKRLSLSVHFRKAKRERAAVAAILAALAPHRAGVRVVPGKKVFNVLPASAPHKGDALQEWQRRERADVALYVGDDVTDEDVFRLAQPDRLITVRVEPSRTSAASYWLSDQREVDRLLKHLVALRRTHD